MTITTTTATAVPSQAAHGTGTRTGDGPARDAWQREMERAQARDWFRAAAVDTTAAPAETHNHRGASAQARPHVARARLPQAPVAWTTATSLPPSAIPAPTDPQQSGHTAWARPPMADDDDTSAGSTVAPNAQVQTHRRAVGDRVRTAIAPQHTHEDTTPGHHAPPVRAHVEWQGDTAHVWIGIDGRGAAQLTAIAAAVVQQLRDQGLRVGRLVCNGTEHPVPASTTAHPSTTSDADVVVHITTPREF